MPALVAGIHAFLGWRLDREGVYGRDKPGHDGVKVVCKVV
jgi:hypothetical protein